MKRKLKKYSWLLILIAIIIALSIGAWVFISKRADRDRYAISESEAFSLIQQCKADGVYSYDSGEAGLILKPTPGEALQGASVNSSPTDNFKRVKGTTAERLGEQENQSCPFTRRAIE